MAAIAVLGTGVMGAPMARNLARAGNTVRAWNRSSEKAQPLSSDGVEVHEDPAGAANGADVVMTMLADADAVLDVAKQAGLADGQIW
jgi:3-hydroxyisobutyrate dehydrogenase